MSDVPPALAALYASERAAGGASATDRERIRNAVLVSLGVTVAAGGATSAGAATSAATTAAGGIAGKLVIVLVTLGAIGGGAALLSRDAATDGSARTVTSEARTSRELAASPGATVPSASVPTARSATPTSLPTTPPPLSSTPPPSRSRARGSAESRATVIEPAAAPTPAPLAESPATAPAESDVQRLARAVTLSARGDAAGALALLDGVASTSPVAEERDALRVITFAKLGRTDEACAAAAAFVARHPNSIHRAAVEEVPCSSAP